MSTTEVETTSRGIPSGSRPISRSRRDKATMATFRKAIVAVVEENRPCSVRQVYYLGIGRLWDKDQGGERTSYRQVVWNLGVMRENGMIPFGWITDSTRYRVLDDMYLSVGEAMAAWTETYRRDLWAAQPRRVEVWTESNSIRGVIERTVRTIGVGLFACSGQAPKTLVNNAATEWMAIGKPVTVVYVGDWDPSGLAIPRSLLERGERYSKNRVSIDVQRIAVTAGDVARGDLISHAVNQNDTNYRSYIEECRLVGLDPQVAVEVEAINPEVLRQRVGTTLYGLVDDPDTWNATLVAEESEREIMSRLTGDVERWGAP